MAVEFTVENQVQDKNLMSPLAKKTAGILETEDLTIVADNGYDSTSDVAQVVRDGMHPVVAGGDYEFLAETTPEDAEHITSYTDGLAHSVYLPERNVFVCPMGEVLYPSSYNQKKHIAKYLNYGGATTADAVKKLKEKGYVNYEPYGNITLTDLGEKTVIIKKYRHNTISCSSVLPRFPALPNFSELYA